MGKKDVDISVGGIFGGMLSCRLLCDTLTFWPCAKGGYGISFKFAVNAITWLPSTWKSASCFSHRCWF